MRKVKQQESRGNHLLFTMLFSLIALSALPYADFTKSNGVVTDSVTTLQWQDDYSDNGGNVKITTWTAAINYCEILNLDGGGWRLPNKKELLSIVDYSRHSPSVDTVFSNTVSNHYWSSTTIIDSVGYAWVVDLGLGNTSYSKKTYTRNVCCVR